jgi:hypothetical protein
LRTHLLTIPATVALGLLTACSNSPGGNAAGDVPTATPSQSWDCSEDSTLSMGDYTEHCMDGEGAETEEADATASTPAVQPIDGGTYTWPNGIGVSYKVEPYGKFGETQDWCGDGSCGINYPDDSDLGIVYTVSVPADYSGTFDPLSCGGTLSVVNGVDDDASNLWAGPHNTNMTGPMLPGSTKTATNEYVIAKAYAGQQFLLTTSCGDTNYSGQQALFTGNLG